MKKIPQRASALGVLLLAACGSRTSLGPGPPEFDDGSTAVGGKGVGGFPQGVGGTGGFPQDGGIGGTGAQPVGSGASPNGGGGSGGRQPMGGSGGEIQTEKGTFCESDLGTAFDVDLWVGPSAFHVLFVGGTETSLWSHPVGEGAWTRSWVLSTGNYATPRLTGFPAGDPLVVTNTYQCPIGLLSGGVLSCFGELAAIGDVHVVGTADAYAVSGSSVLRYDGMSWQAAMTLPSSDLYEVATSVWADDSSVLVGAQSNAPSGVVYSGRPGESRLTSEIYVQGDDFADVAGSGPLEWTISRRGSVYQNSGSGWGEFATLDPGCSSFAELWAVKLNVYAHTYYRVVRLRAGSGNSLLDLPCDGSAAIVALSGRALTDNPYDDAAELYVATLDSSRELEACGGVRIMSSDGSGWIAR